MIILLGLPKCGTCSFQSLFISLGYKSYHWVKDWAPDYIGMMIYKNKQNNLPLLNDFCDTDVITQMDICLSKELSYWPQIVDYKQLYEENLRKKRVYQNAISEYYRQRKEEYLQSTLMEGPGPC